VIPENLHNETEIRRFLLGEMREDERAAFEENFFANEDLFEQIRVCEDELIESYIRKTLDASELEKFEKNFLTTKNRRQRVAFTREMLAKLPEYKETAAAKKTETAAVQSTSVWTSIAYFFKTPKLAFGSAFALLVLVFGGWLLLRNPKQADIAQQITPTPTIEVTQTNQNLNLPSNQNVSVNLNTNTAENIPDNKNVSPNANRETPNNQNTNTQKQPPNGITPVLALFAGTVRSNGKMSELNLPKNAAGASLQLNLESNIYKIYMVEIVDADGNLVLKNNNLKARNSKINLFIPAAKLRRGDFIVRLSALNPQNENESVADYTFRVNRK